MCVNRLKSPSFISNSRGHKMDAVFKRARMTIPHAAMLTMEFLTQRLHHCISSKIYQGLRWMFLFGHLFLWCLRGTCSKPWIYGSYVRFEELQSQIHSVSWDIPEPRISSTSLPGAIARKAREEQNPTFFKDSHGILMWSKSTAFFFISAGWISHILFTVIEAQWWKYDRKPRDFSLQIDEGILKEHRRAPKMTSRWVVFC